MPVAKPLIVIPLDTRPPCYEALLDLAAMAQIQLLLPPKAVLGHLKEPAAFEELLWWWRSITIQYPYAGVIMGLDTMMYGGLIPSRSHQLPMATLEDRLAQFLGSLLPSHRPRYGISSIMRIPAYNNAEEEPDYWAQWGLDLYNYSAAVHQATPDALASAKILTERIPNPVMADFMERRQTNEQMNQALLQLSQVGVMDYLVFGQDDTGPYGLNVQEAQTLEALIEERSLTDRCHVQTGADEVVQLLMAKALWSSEMTPLTIHVDFSPESSASVMAKFDGLPLQTVVDRQLQTLGAIQSSPDACELKVIVHGPAQIMGDHLGSDTEQQPQASEQAVSNTLNTLQAVIDKEGIAVVADVVYANGGDPLLVQALCQPQGKFLQQLENWGYTGWNTPGNTIGSALAQGALMVWAKNQGVFNAQAQSLTVIKHLLDDGYYQGQWRRTLKAQQPQPNDAIAQTLAQSITQTLQSWPWVTQQPGLTTTLIPTFPCQRFFEIQLVASLQPEMVITSPSNQQIKAASELHQRKHRDAYDLILVEGRHPFEEAVNAGLWLNQLFIADSEPPPDYRGILPTRVSAAVMGKLASTAGVCPIVGVFEKPPLVQADTLFKTLEGPLVGLFELQDPGNLGTIIRSACAFGASALVTIGHHVDLYHPKVIRASAGLCFRLPLLSFKDPQALFDLLDQYPHITRYAAVPGDGTPYHAVPFTAPSILLLGSEAHGIPDQYLGPSTHRVNIPTQEGVDSLNVAMAATVLLSNAFQQTRT